MNPCNLMPANRVAFLMHFLTASSSSPALVKAAGPETASTFFAPGVLLQAVFTKGICRKTIPLWRRLSSEDLVLTFLLRFIFTLSNLASRRRIVYRFPGSLVDIGCSSATTGKSGINSLTWYAYTASSETERLVNHSDNCVRQCLLWSR